MPRTCNSDRVKQSFIKIWVARFEQREFPLRKKSIDNFRKDVSNFVVMKSFYFVLWILTGKLKMPCSELFLSKLDETLTCFVTIYLSRTNSRWNENIFTTRAERFAWMERKNGGSTNRTNSVEVLWKKILSSVLDRSRCDVVSACRRFFTVTSVFPFSRWVYFAYHCYYGLEINLRGLLIRLKLCGENRASPIVWLFLCERRFIVNHD